MKHYYKRYYIKFRQNETDMTDFIRITSKQYWAEKAKYEDVINNTNEDDDFGKAYKFSKEYDHETNIEYVDYLTLGCTDVVLCRIVCKDGYEFKSR